MSLKPNYRKLYDQRKAPLSQDCSATLAKWILVQIFRGPRGTKFKWHERCERNNIKGTQPGGDGSLRVHRYIFVHRQPPAVHCYLEKKINVNQALQCSHIQLGGYRHVNRWDLFHYLLVEFCLNQSSALNPELIFLYDRPYTTKLWITAHSIGRKQFISFSLCFIFLGYFLLFFFAVRKGIHIIRYF